MNRPTFTVLICLAAAALPAASAVRVKTANGTLEGEESSGIRVFRGIPFARPPVGVLRWQPPQPPDNWKGVREAAKFGPRCMQHAVFGDMNFRASGMSEDCLYLNVWTPAKTGRERLPVLVYFFGGGFVAGDGSEPRYDGESMARKGIVAVTVNYRLAVYGFLAHPELTKESPHKASGNYGLLDNTAALRWVQKNIAAFGGDPGRVTIAGESAGSIAVSAQMATPLAKGLFAGAIGESGSLLGTLSPVVLSEAEKAGVQFATSMKVESLAALRALTAEQIQEATKRGGPAVGRFPLVVDGYFLPEPPVTMFAAGRQNRVRLLAGWNTEESNARGVLGREDPTPENFRKGVERLFGDKAAGILEHYAASTPGEVLQAATDLAGDRFIAFSTWRWADMSARMGGQPVYRYLYARPRPPMRPEMGNATPGLAGGVVRGGDAPPAPPARGAVHSAEIEYAMGNLDSNKVYAWTPDDYKVSRTMQEYFANFIKTGNPNAAGLPEWPKLAPDGTGQYMRIDVESGARQDAHRGRYLFLQELWGGASR
jgi:para-nitrobenzyl esterase